MTLELVGEMDAQVKGWLDRADQAMCYVTESGDVVAVDGEVAQYLATSSDWEEVRGGSESETPQGRKVFKM